MALYAFDGTWNEDEKDEGKDSNVVRFRDAYEGNKHYLEGVGTRLGFIGKLLGGLTGAGGRERIREELKALHQSFARGDRTVDIVGFSRGAALALHFANVLHEERTEVEVRFLALFDVVASFGLPGNEINLGWKLGLPDNVRRCCHAMSLDERRRNFPITRVEVPKGSPPAGARLEDVWFRGVHSDVGGGQSVGLSSISLCWMLRRALDSGVPISRAALAHHEALRDPQAPISKNFDPKLDPPRKIRPGDVVHASVQPRGESGGRHHNDPPAGLRVVSE